MPLRVSAGAHAAFGNGRALEPLSAAARQFLSRAVDERLKQCYISTTIEMEKE